MREVGRRFVLAARKVKPATQIVPVAVALLLVSGLWLGISDPAGLTASTLPTPAPPSNLIALPASNGIYLQWDASPTPAREISEYRIERFREGDSAAVIIKRLPVGRLSHFDSTGLGGIPYRYRVRARDWFLNDSPWSNAVVASYKDSVAPSRPDSMVVTVNPRGLFVDWAPGLEDDLAGYRIYRAIEGSAWRLLAEPDQSQYLDRSAEVATPYLFVTTSVDYSGNESARSDTVRGIIPDGVPPAAVPVFTAVGQPEGIRLQWQPPTDPDLAGFRIARSTNPEFSDPLVQLDASATEYVDSTAVERRFYIYRIAAVDRSGNTGEAVFADATRPDGTAPAAPTGLVAERSETALRLQWTPSPSPDLAYYRVQRESLIDTSRAVTRVDRSLTEYLAFPFSPGLPRRYTVTAVDSSGNESPAVASIETALVPNSFSRRSPEVGSRYRLVARPGAAPGRWEFPGNRGTDWEVLDPLSLAPTTATSEPGVPVWARVAAPSVDTDPEMSPQVVSGGLGFVYTVPVRPGWNALASPFDIQLDWNLILAWNDVTDRLLRHTGRWEEAHVLDPYEGAYWFNDSDRTSLDLPYAVERVSGDSVATSPRVVVRASPASGGVGQFVVLGGEDDVPLPPMPEALSVLTIEGDAGEPLLYKSVAQLEGAATRVHWRGEEQVIRVTVVEQPPGLAVRLTDDLGTSHVLTEAGTLLNTLSGSFMLDVVPSGDAPTPTNQFGLLHVFPRPASASVTLVYAVTATGQMAIEVFDLLGRRVAVLEDRWRVPGQYQVRWEPASGLPDGSYLVSLSGPEGRSTRALQIVR